MTEPRSSDEVATRVLDACKKKDEQARVVYVGKNDYEETTVRIRAGNAASICALQQQMTGLFPFAKIRTSESVLDGKIYAEITVPGAVEEWRFAKLDASNKPLVQVMRLLSFALFLVAFLLYVDNLQQQNNQK
jgi:hypothetical protein